MGFSAAAIIICLYTLATVSFIGIVYLMFISDMQTAILLSFIAMPILIFIIHGVILFSIKEFRDILLEPLFKAMENEDIYYLVITNGSILLYFIIMTFIFPEFYIENLFICGFIIGFNITMFIRDSYRIRKIRRGIR
jgi:hypothetical protein